MDWEGFPFAGAGLDGAAALDETVDSHPGWMAALLETNPTNTPPPPPEPRLALPLGDAAARAPNADAPDLAARATGRQLPAAPGAVFGAAVASAMAGDRLAAPPGTTTTTFPPAPPADDAAAAAHAALRREADALADLGAVGLCAPLGNLRGADAHKQHAALQLARWYRRPGGNLARRF